MQRELFEDEHEQLRTSFRAWLAAEVVLTWTTGTGPASCRGRSSLRPAGTASSASTSRRSTAAEASATSATISWSWRRSRPPGPEARARADPAQRHLPPVLLEVLHGRAAGALASRHRQRGAHHRDRDDRAGDRQRPGVDVHVSDPGRRSVRRERLEDLHHQRHQRRSRDHGGQDRSVAAPRRHVPARAGAGHGRVRARPQPGRSVNTQDTAELFFSDVSVPVENLLGSEGEGFIQLVHNLPQERLSARRRGGRRALGWTLDYVKERRPSASRSARSRTPGSCWPRWRRSWRSPSRSSTVASSPSTPGRSPPRTPPWPSGGAPSCRSARSTVACSCSAATATCSSTRSPAYVDARITTIYGGTTEIMKEIVGRQLGP